MGKGKSGKVRGPPVDSKTKARISKTLQVICGEAVIYLQPQWQEEDTENAEVDRWNVQMPFVKLKYDLKKVFWKAEGPSLVTPPISMSNVLNISSHSTTVHWKKWQWWNRKGKLSGKREFPDWFCWSLVHQSILMFRKFSPIVELVVRRRKREGKGNYESFRGGKGWKIVFIQGWVVMHIRTEFVWMTVSNL